MDFECLEKVEGLVASWTPENAGAPVAEHVRRGRPPLSHHLEAYWALMFPVSLDEGEPSVSVKVSEQVLLDIVLGEYLGLADAAAMTLTLEGRGVT